jgi:hypothetical protein
MHLESLNLTLNSQLSKRDEWKGVYSADKDVKNVKSPREIPWSRPPSIYRVLQTKELLALGLASARGNRTRRRGVTGCFKTCSFDSNGHLTIA